MDIGGAGPPTTEGTTLFVRTDGTILASIPTAPPVSILSMIAGYLPLVILGASLGALIWAWAETFARIREADARLGRWPRFAVVALLAASGFMASGMIVLSGLAWSPPIDRIDSTFGLLYALIGLPAIGLVLIALLARLDRSYGWTRLLRERNEHQAQRDIADENRTIFAESVQSGLDPAVMALESVHNEIRRHGPANEEATLALRTIATEVHRLKEIQAMSKRVHQGDKEPDPVDLTKTCEELLRRVHASYGHDHHVQFYGADDIRLVMRQHHLNAYLWGLLRAAFATADPDDPVVEALFTRDETHLIITIQSNGGGIRNIASGDDRDEALEECRLIADLHEGKILPPAWVADDTICTAVHLRLIENAPATSPTPTADHCTRRTPDTFPTNT